MNNWKKIAIEPPTGETRVIEVGKWTYQGIWISDLGRSSDATNNRSGYTHWREHDNTPPPDDRSQREFDQAKAQELIRKLGTGNDAILEAIYDERRALRALLVQADPTGATWMNTPLDARLEELGEPADPSTP